MIIFSDTRTSIQRPGTPDGTPGPRVEHLVDAALLGKSGRMFAQVTLAPGAAIAVHPHHGEFEIYMLLTGGGEYNDNGTFRQVAAGDATFCPDGEFHGLKNTGAVPLDLIAFIGNDK